MRIWRPGIWRSGIWRKGIWKGLADVVTPPVTPGPGIRSTEIREPDASVSAAPMAVSVVAGDALAEVGAVLAAPRVAEALDRAVIDAVVSAAAARPGIFAAKVTRMEVC